MKNTDKAFIRETLEAFAHPDIEDTRKAHLVCEFSRHVRQIAERETAILEWIKYVYSRYRHLHTDEDRLAAHLMSALLYEALPMGVGVAYAKECLEAYKPDSPNPATSRSEMIFFHYFSQLSEAEKTEMLRPCALRISIPDVLEPKFRCTDLQDVPVVFDLGDELCAYRDADRGALVLRVCNDCAQDILIDEEEFNNEEPLYFTESSHFTSPVFLVTKAKHILNEILTQMGYPYVRIRTELAFVSRYANPYNMDCMYDIESKGDWLGLDLKVLLASRGDFEKPCHGTDLDGFSFELSTALKATMLVYHHLHGTYTLNDIRKAIKELEIFTI